MIAVNPNLTFLRSQALNNRILVLQGGTRSGKTYSAIMYLIELAYQFYGAGMIISVARETMPALRATVLRDFIEILSGFDNYSDANWNKRDMVYNLYGNQFEFFSLTDEQKVRGRKRDILYVNEANECSYDAWRQLIFRTKGFIVIDYNPSMEDHWIYDHVLKRPDHKMIVTTYKDNPHLNKEIIHEIELLIDSDPNYWSIYGLGLKGVPLETIYTHWKSITSVPDDWKYCYGLDFGYNVPTVLMKCAWSANKEVWDEEIYQSHMSTSELINLMKQLNISKSKIIFADSEDPEAIEEIRKAGFNCRAAEKSVLAGINKIKSLEFFITERSVNTRKEIRGYKWRSDKNGNKLDEPIKVNDHAMDSGRYGTYNHRLKLNKAKFNWD